MSRTISDKGLDLIKFYEGCKLTAYQDTGGVWTIGYGMTNYVSNITGLTIKKGTKITQKQADDYFRKIINAIFVPYVNNKKYVPLTDKLNQNQFDALVSFSYNCGCGGLQKLCKDRTLKQISNHFGDFIKDSKGNILKGLINRRNTEKELFNTPIEEPIKKEEPKKETTSNISTSCLELQKAINKDKIAKLKEDGICGDNTLTAINKICLKAQKNSKTGTYSTGSTGNVVKFVQKKVGANADGNYGSNTRNKVIAFQKKHKLVQDGICGPKTLLKMI